ncbi:MAG: alpha/beta hydrolase [Deltaproteobacteria bacterium]|nr:alpha/beta hydrolase [Deltaproteobacteria bacterium]
MPPTLLLIHGQLFDRRSWELVLPLLKVPAVAVDLPDHGGNPSHASTLQAMGGEVLAARRGIEGPVVAVGHSLGALVVLEALIADPAAFSAVLLLGLPEEPTPENRAAMASMADMVEVHGLPDPLLSALVLGMMSAEHQAQVGDALGYLKRYLDVQPERAVRVGRAIAARLAVAPRLPEVIPPTRVLTGLVDVNTPIDRARPLAEALGAPIEATEGGHLLLLEHPALVAAAIEERLERVV